MNTIHNPAIAIVAILSCFIPIPKLGAQHLETPVFEQRGPAIREARQEIIRKAVALRGQVPAIDKVEIDRQLIDPVPQPVKLTTPHTRVLSPEEIATHARNANLRAGYCFKCMKCDDWHLSLAGAYAIASDVIVTCDHVMVNNTEMRDGFFIVADHEGNVAIAVAVLARSEAMDAAVIRVAGAEFTPVPINPDVMQGGHAFCFSYPLRQEGFFSSGIVNRFFWNEHYRGEDPDSLDALIHLRVNFSTDWAPGSSGSAIFDSRGNAIGHVSTITGLSHGNSNATLLTLRTGIPARSVKGLVDNLGNPDEIRRVALLGSPESGVAAEPDEPQE